MGNVSPSKCFRNGSANDVRIATIKVLENCKCFKNFILSSGCDIPPLTEFENIDAFFETVKAFNYKNKLMDMIA
jgi:uroporphyrinogen decarboxylase